MWPAPVEHVTCFVAYLSIQGKSHATVRTYLAGIAATHKLNGWPDPTATFLTQKLLQGLRRLTHKADARYPITFDRLSTLIAVLPSVCADAYEARLFKAVFSLAFFGFFRISELLGQSKSLVGGRPPLQLVDVTDSVSSLVLFLRGSKTDTYRQGLSISIPRVGDSPDACPVLSMRAYLAVRPHLPGDLFIHFDGSPLSRYQFQAVLKKAATLLNWPPGFSAHSFRIGAATTAALNSVPVAQIMTLGRWSSSAAFGYIRLHKV